MRLKKMKFKDLYSTKDLDTILLRDSILKRFTLIITSYFCLGTELRFLKQMKLQGFADSQESQFWHGRALEMALYFLPGDSPLVKHIIQSYNKHHSPSNMPIPEGTEVSSNVKVLSPLKGIHVQKVNPIIQDLDHLYRDENKGCTVI